MAISTVSVCNSALIKVGADRISSLTQETRSAILLNAIFESVRDDLLRGHAWKFAIRRATLAPNSTTPAFGYTYEYDFPSDCLRPLDTDPDDVDFVVETDAVSGNKVILTDEASLDIRYIWKQTDPTTWDSNFAEALSWRLAREVSYALTQSAAMVDVCDKQFDKVISNARAMSSIECPVKDFEIDNWILSRR